MKNNNKVITIGGMPVTEKALEKQAIVLTSLANRVGILTRLLDSICVGYRTDPEFSINYFMASGGMGEVMNYLDDLKADIEQVSNSICPD